MIFCTPAAHITAQKKLIPFPQMCSDHDTNTTRGCSAPVFVEEGAVHPDSCTYYLTVYDRFGLGATFLYSNYPVIVNFDGRQEHGSEFSDLSLEKGIIDSTNDYLLADHVREFVKIIKDSVGYDSVTASYCFSCSTSNTPRFSICIQFTNTYKIWSMWQWWAAAQGVDSTSDEFKFSTLNRKYGSYLSLPNCSIATSVANTDPATNGECVSTPREIRLHNIHGYYVVADISGSIVTQGVMVPGEPTHIVSVNPGVYVVATSTMRKKLIVMP